MEIKERMEGGARIISLFGVVEEKDLKELDSLLVDHSGERLVIDLTRLDYVNSQGISIFLAAWRRARREGGMFVLGAPRGAVRKIFEVAHIGNFIPLRETVLEAVEACCPAIDKGPNSGAVAATNEKSVAPAKALKEEQL